MWMIRVGPSPIVSDCQRELRRSDFDADVDGRSVSVTCRVRERLADCRQQLGQQIVGDRVERTLDDEARPEAKPVDRLSDGECQLICGRTGGVSAMQRKDR